MKISVISPVYGADTLLYQLVSQIEQTVRKLTNEYEIILVDDCGPDSSGLKIREICSVNTNVIGVFHSKNFGQQYAIHSGLSVSTGDYVVTLDCDLQDTPSFIENLYYKAQEGYDIVYASRQNRQDGWIKKTGSKVFNVILGYLTNTVQDETVANYVLYRRRAVDALLSMGDMNKYYPLMNRWVGFSTCKLEIPHAKREDGKSSSYSLKRRISLAINTSLSFSTKPLKLIIVLGSVISIASLFVALYFVIHYLVTGISVDGWLTLFVSLWLLSGILIMILGVVALYVASIFEQTKNRPVTIISETINLKTR